MNGRRRVLGRIPIVVLLAPALLFVATGQTPVPAEEPAAFDMKEVSAFAADPSGRPTYLRGQLLIAPRLSKL